MKIIKPTIRTFKGVSTKHPVVSGKKRVLGVDVDVDPTYNASGDVIYLGDIITVVDALDPPPVLAGDDTIPLTLDVAGLSDELVISLTTDVALDIARVFDSMAIELTVELADTLTVIDVLDPEPDLQEAGNRTLPDTPATVIDTAEIYLTQNPPLEAATISESAVIDLFDYVDPSYVEIGYAGSQFTI